MASPAAVGAPPAARGGDVPRLPRVARFADPGFRSGARSVGDPRARLPNRRADHRLRPHPPARGPRPRLEDHRQRRIRGLCVRRRPDRVVGPGHRRRRDRLGGDPADGVRHDGRLERDLRSWPARRRLPGRDRPDGEARPMTSPAKSTSWPSEPRRVVVTGMGMLTALGNDVASTWRGMVSGRSGIRTIESFDPSRLAARIAGEVRDLDASRILDKKEVRRTDRYIQFGLVASRQAMDQAGLPERLEGEEAERTGVILGTGLGGVGTLVEGISINALRGPDRISPFLIPMGIPNVGAGHVGISFGMTGPNFTTASACATGGHAIGESYETIRRNDADMMIAGGSEAGVYEPLVGGVDPTRALSPRNERPG